jgi:hypothetical protein
MQNLFYTGNQLPTSSAQFKTLQINPNQPPIDFNAMQSLLNAPPKEPQPQISLLDSKQPQPPPTTP